MSIYRYILIASLVFTTQAIVSQNIKVNGKVLNNNTDKPVSGVVIKLNNSNASTTTNQSGSFLLQCDLSKNPILSVSHIGYTTLQVPLTKITPVNPLIIKIVEWSLNLNEVEILGKFNKNIPITIEKINTKQLDETNTTDIGTLLSKEPNVGGIRKGATGIDPVIRGFKYSQLSIQLDDGTKIEGGCPNRMDPTAAHININDISSISIYKGPFALKYGPSFGGLVFLETYKPKFHNKYENNVSLILGGQTNHTGYRTGIRVDGGNKNISYLIAANKNKYNDYESGNGDIFKASSDNYNITGTIGYRIAEGHIISISTDRSWGRNVDYPTLPMDERNDDTQIYKFSYLGTNISKSINFIKLKAYSSIVDHEMDNKNRPFSDTVVAISKINATNTGGNLGVNMNMFGGNIEVGSNVEQITKDGNRIKHLIMQPNLPVLEENLWNNANILNIGFYAEYQRIINKISWIAALRTDINSATSGPMLRLKKNGNLVYENNDTKSNYFNISASLGLTWHLSTKTDLYISVGRGTRSPDMTERFIILLPVGYDPYDYLGNPQLKPENNHEVDLGINRSCNFSGQFSASVFFSYVTDYISSVIVPPSQVKPQTKGVLGVKNFINIDEAYLTGFELKYNTPESNRWQVKLNTAYTTGINPNATRIIFEDGNAVNEETVKNDPLPEIPPLEANIWFNYKLFDDKLVPELHFRIAAEQSKVSKAYNESSTPGFNLLNFRLAYRYSKNLNLTFGVNNIFNTNYYEHLNRRIIGTKAPYFEPGRFFYTNLIIKL